MRTLVIIPTYNESENIAHLTEKLFALEANFDLLFVDDSSPDGTSDIIAALMQKNPRIRLLRRPGKLGLGGAHRDGLLEALKNQYDYAITMDADLTHSSEDLLRVLNEPDDCSLLLTSRFLVKGSLAGWSLYRLGMTYFGHALTRVSLGLSFDVTGALRRYRLRDFSDAFFKRPISESYSFLPETVLLASQNGKSIREISVSLPARTYGSSKMTLTEALRTVSILLSLAQLRVCHPETLQIGWSGGSAVGESSKNDSTVRAWNRYWQAGQGILSSVFGSLASIYRRFFIKPRLSSLLHNSVPRGSRLLHVGSGSGEVDIDLSDDYQITALDISPASLERYRINNPRNACIQGSIFSPPSFPEKFDGLYSLGLLEHFTPEQVVTIFKRSAEVCKPGGVLLFSWPTTFSSSVLFIRLVELSRSFVANLLGMSVPVPFHPAEVFPLPSLRRLKILCVEAGLKVESTSFGYEDGWVQMFITLRR